ncbi:MAG: type IV pilus modification protein PilV [Burkholderiales bacterium]|nr:type IV pilus modification protein PilV [Burkholderiales bacterium]
MTSQPARAQQGMILIEALIGILIFSMGILALIAMQASAISAQADAQYRIEAANFADRILGEIWLNVDRSSTANLQTSLGTFAHRTTTTGPCNFGGAASSNTAVTGWVNDVTASTGLPGSSAAMQQILVNTGTFNQVIITVCWRAPNDPVARQHLVISNVN